MSSIVRNIALVLVLFTTSLFASDVGKIAGTVYDDDGVKGIQGAIVHVFDIDGCVVDSIYTSTTGWFEKSVPSGEYIISAEKGNYIRRYHPDAYLLEEAKSVIVYPGQYRIVSFKLERGGWLGGGFAIRGDDIHQGLVTAIKIDEPFSGYFKSAVLQGPFPSNYAITGLLPGVYKIAGRANGRETLYYPGVENFDDAEMIHILSNEGVPDISFDLERVGSGIISGRAYDVETGAGLEGLSVFAYQWKNFWEDPNFKISETDFDGTFEIELSSGDYYLCARCVDCNINSENIFMYYDGQFDPDRAELVEVTDNSIVGNINFGFDFSNSYNLSIAGRVLNDQTGQGLGGVTVTAIDYQTGQDISSSLSITDGEFSIDDLTSGQYLLMFSGSNIIPYFYRGSETWQDAEIIELSADYRGIQSDAITQDYGNLGLLIAGQISSDGGPLSGVRVYAYPVDSDRPVAFAISSASGEYSIIRGLVPGAYTVVCDMMGFDSETYPENIELDLLHNPEATGIDFHLESPSTGIVDKIDLPEKIELGGNYPNPFNSRTLIDLYSSYEHDVITKLVVFNILGGKIGEKRVVIRPGANTIEWSSDDFDRSVSSGVYFYRIEGVSSVSRMVLLK